LMLLLILELPSLYNLDVAKSVTSMRVMKNVSEEVLHLLES